MKKLTKADLQKVVGGKAKPVGCGCGSGGGK
ncbi:MAG: bacteriocin [Ardenticatenaceae bacterium]|nr:bacteriocin [Ardenticatenaceae bacterium]